MKLQTSWEEFDEVAFNEGIIDGKAESFLVNCPVVAHEGMGEAYCTGFSFGMKAGRAFDAGFKAGKHLNLCCCHLADGEDPDLALEWMEGLWMAFSEVSSGGLSA